MTFLEPTSRSVQRKSKKVMGTNTSGRQCSSAIGLYRKMLRIAVGGIFEHKPLFDWRYPVRSTYLWMFSVLCRSSVLNRLAMAQCFFPALLYLLSFWSSLLTVAFCYPQSWCSFRQMAKIFKKVRLSKPFLGVGFAVRLVHGITPHDQWAQLTIDS